MPYLLSLPGAFPWSSKNCSMLSADTYGETWCGLKRSATKLDEAICVSCSIEVNSRHMDADDSFYVTMVKRMKELYPSSCRCSCYQPHVRIHVSLVRGRIGPRHMLSSRQYPICTCMGNLGSYISSLCLPTLPFPRPTSQSPSQNLNA